MKGKRLVKKRQSRNDDNFGDFRPLALIKKIALIMSTLQTALRLLLGTAFYPQWLPDLTPTIKVEEIVNKLVIHLLMFLHFQQSCFFPPLGRPARDLTLNTVNTFFFN